MRHCINAITPRCIEEIDRSFYDVIGVFEGIEVTEVFESFITKFANFKELMENYFLTYRTNQEKVRDLMHLTHLLIMERGGQPIRKV